MPGTSSNIISSTFSGTPIESHEYSSLQQVLTGIPNNTDNLIDAKDVRNAVYTLWNRTDSLGSDITFTNSTPTPQTIGGIPAGSTFNNVSIEDMFQQLLYPYIAPTANLSPNRTREFGDPTGIGVNSITFNWSVTRNSLPISQIIVAGQSITPTGNSQNGTVAVTGTHSWNPTTSTSQSETFTLNVSDGQSNVSNSATLTFTNRRYWGRIDLGGVNLTGNPGLIPSVSNQCTDNVIRNLNGAGVGSGSELSTSINKNYNGINGAGQHLIFAWPSGVSNSKSPTFTVNGLPNTAFTRVRTDSSFVNQFGFTTNYEVWVSNTAQNSPISQFSIS